MRSHSLPEGEVDPISSNDLCKKKSYARLSSSLANEEMHVHSGVFGDCPIRYGLSLLLSGRRRAGAGSRTREEPSETRRMPKSHSRPEDTHLEHLGRVSSHLILLKLKSRVSKEASHISGAVYRQVLHPSLVGLEVTTRFLPISCYFGRTTIDEPGRPSRYFASIKHVTEHG